MDRDTPDLQTPIPGWNKHVHAYDAMTMRRSEVRSIRWRGWLWMRGAVNPLTWMNWMMAAAALVGLK